MPGFTTTGNFAVKFLIFERLKNYIAILIHLSHCVWIPKRNFNYEIPTLKEKSHWYALQYSKFKITILKFSIKAPWSTFLFFLCQNLKSLFSRKNSTVFFFNFFVKFYFRLECKIRVTMKISLGHGPENFFQSSFYSSIFKLYDSL